MISQYDKPVNTQVVVTCKISTTTVPSDLTLLLNGTTSSTSTSFTNLTSNGLCNFTFTPTSTGTYTLYADSAIQATVEVVSKTKLSFLQNLEDESLGSWTWDKTSGALALLRQDGTALASFNVVDNLTTSSRERL